jgi:hypothetical protein
MLPPARRLDLRGQTGGARRSQRGSLPPQHAWEGRQWALAIDAATPCASYRPDLLNRLHSPVPRTWEETLRLAKEARRRQQYVALPLGPVDAITALLSLATNLGPPPFTSDQEVVARETGLRALQTLAELVALGPSDLCELTPITLMERMSTTDDVVYCPLAYSYTNYSRPGYRPHLCLYDDIPGYDDRGPLRLAPGRNGSRDLQPVRRAGSRGRVRAPRRRGRVAKDALLRRGRATGPRQRLGRPGVQRRVRRFF